MTSPDFPTMDPRRGDAIESMLRATVADDADARPATKSRRRTRGILIASMATACVVIGAGVTFAATHTAVSPQPDRNVAVPTSHPRPTASTSPEPSGTGSPGIVDPAGTASPVPTPTPTADIPTDVSTWKITTAGIGPLEIGMQLSAADAVATEARLKITDCGSPPAQGTHFYQLSDGTQILAGLGEGGKVSYLAVILASPDKSTTGTVSTRHGIRIGSTSAELFAAYPGVESHTVGTYPLESGYGLSDGAGHWIVFEVDNASSKVQDIYVSAYDEIPSEYCG